MKNIYLHELGNPLVAFLKGIALELEDLRDSMHGTLNAMTIFGAKDKYLDFWGSYMNIGRGGSNNDYAMREEGESDQDYALRIMFLLKQTQVNNRSIEILIKEILGFQTEVIDLGIESPDNLLFMNNTGTFINDINYAVWNESEFDPDLATFYVKLIDPVYDDLTTDEKTELSNFVNLIKASGIEAVYTLS